MRANAIHWSNLPLGVVPRDGLRLGDLDAAKGTAARDMLAASLSACGLTLLDEIRRADDALIPLDTRKVGWDGRNYFLTILGTPSNEAPWMLQVGGHHLAYNLTFNGKLPGATPLFFGTEPIRFTQQGKDYEPLQLQSAAMSRLATAIAATRGREALRHLHRRGQGRGGRIRPGKPPVGGTDTGYPHDYPTGTTDRGVRYDSLRACRAGARARGHRQLHRRCPAKRSRASWWRRTCRPRHSPTPTSATPARRISARKVPTCASMARASGWSWWCNVRSRNRDELHFHALWRDKLADYGGEVGK